jgi:hypothetical protein
MLRNPRRIASLLLASLMGSIAFAGAARAEPAAAATADCLVKPSAPAAAGKHWYYRVDRASGRHCWYLRAASTASNESAQPRTPSRATVSPPADNPPPEPSADMRSDAGDQDTAPPAPAMAAPAPQPSWSTAAPPPAPEPMTTPASDSATPAPALPPQPVAAEPPRAEPAPTAPIRAQVPERPTTVPTTVVEDGGHLPAIFGTALVLLIIVVGSIVVRLAAKLIRSRRRGSAPRAPAAMPPPPILRAQDAPALVPPMPHEGDVAREPRVPRAPRRMPAVRQNEATAGSDTAAHDPARARELEQNVRDLLHRMRSDLPMEPRAQVKSERPQLPSERPQPSPERPQPSSERAQPPSAQELDQVLAMWREGRRRRTAG